MTTQAPSNHDVVLPLDHTQRSELPVLDLRRWDDPATRNGCRAALTAATRDYGFFYLTGHGIPETLQRKLIETCRQFFALPGTAKHEIAKEHSPHFRGYSRVGEEITRGRQDWREQVDIGPERAALAGAEQPDWAVLQGPNQWPAQLPQFREVIESWQRHTERVARTLLAAWLQALGQPADALDAAFTEPDVLLKVVRYPANPGGRTANDRSQGVGAHKDSGWLTLLFVEPGKGGLQVRHDDRWIDAPPLPGALIVNIGELLEWATSGYLRATVHRVVSAPGTGDRISVPYFFNPAYGAEIPQWPLPPELAAGMRGVEQDPDNRIYSNYGLNALKSRLRSHPEVTARYHAALAERLAHRTE